MTSESLLPPTRKPRPERRLRASVLALLILGTPSLSLASWVGNLQVVAGGNDNVGSAERSADKRGDVVAGYLGSAGGRFQIASGGSLTATGIFEILAFNEIDGLDRSSLGASISYGQKTRFGSRAPWVQVFASAIFQGYRDDNRTGWIQQAMVRYGWVAGTRTSFTVAGSYLLRNASETVFDRRSAGLSFSADVSLGANVALYAAYQIQRGDVNVSSRPDPSVRQIAKERAPDPVFGPGFIVYRLDATSHDLLVGINVALSRHAAIDVAYEGLLATAAGGVDYVVNQIRGSYLYRF